jgi:hypothetical protein
MGMDIDRQRAYGRLGGHVSWAHTEDRAARTAPARQGLENKFLEQAGGDPKRAANIRQAHYQRMALKSAESRRRRKGVA